jgi:hypothetical protein
MTEIEKNLKINVKVSIEDNFVSNLIKVKKLLPIGKKVLKENKFDKI